MFLTGSSPEVVPVVPGQSVLPGLFPEVPVPSAGPTSGATSACSGTLLSPAYFGLEVGPELPGLPEVPGCFPEVPPSLVFLLLAVGGLFWVGAEVPALGAVLPDPRDLLRAVMS